MPYTSNKSLPKQSTPAIIMWYLTAGQSSAAHILIVYLPRRCDLSTTRASGCARNGTNPGLLRRQPGVSEEHITSIFRVKKQVMHETNTRRWKDKKPCFVGWRRYVTSETSSPFRTVRRHNPQDGTFPTHRRENLKSKMSALVIVGDRSLKN
jgi:hypothetical protein